MDPNLFHIDWDRVIEVLVAIIIASFLVERALALVFESRLFLNHAKEKGYKEFIALAVGVFVCIQWDIDAFSIIFLRESVSWYGAAITGAVVAGGSKASIKLFRDIMKIRSNEEDLRLTAKEEARAKSRARVKAALEGGGQG